MTILRNRVLGISQIAADLTVVEQPQVSIFIRAVQALFSCCHAIELLVGLMVVANPGTPQVRVDGMVDHHLPSKLPRLSVPRTAVREEPLVDFVGWLATCSQLSWSAVDHQLQLILPESDRNQFGGCDTVTISADGRQFVDPASDAGSPLDWLRNRAGERESPAYARPVGEPLAVHEITAKIFPHYEVNGGTSHLVGCQLEDRSFVRLTFLDKNSDDLRVNHFYIATDGSSVPNEMVTELGLDQVEPIPVSQPSSRPSQLDVIANAGLPVATQQSDSTESNATLEAPVVVTVIWVKYVLGQLQFTIGNASVMHAFEGWARTLQAVPYQCPVTSTRTFKLGQVDDGTIVAADEIDRCDMSGVQVLRSDLVTCNATGKNILPQFVKSCPVSEQPVLSENFATCSRCREEVSLPALQKEVCAACHSLRPVSKADPTIGVILQKYPALARWRSWRLSQTRCVSIVQASGMVRKLLIVCDRQTQTIKRISVSRRGSSRWKVVNRRNWSTCLGR